jgi:SAM-dependent methyltransferase
VLRPHIPAGASIKPSPEPAYEPLASVWYGGDAALIERMLEFYPRTPPRIILDATVNRGRFWRGTTRKVIGLDVEKKHRPTVVGNNMRMPFVPDCIDVVVYDPPHIPNQGRDHRKDFNTRFGLVLRAGVDCAYNLAHLYPRFAAEAYRVLRPEGILLCKIADYVHNHRMHWAHIDMVLAARGAGFVACDCILKVRKGPIVDPRWKVAHHSRHQHCYWLVFRKSSRCE